MRRVSDQVMILTAIGEVREELKRAGSDKDRYEVLGRLITLYSLLRVRDIKQVLEASDTRDNKRRDVA